MEQKTNLEIFSHKLSEILELELKALGIQPENDALHDAIVEGIKDGLTEQQLRHLTSAK